MQPDERGECRLWDPVEDEAVLAYFPEHGRDWDGWARLLPGRSFLPGSGHGGPWWNVRQKS